jgi:hypothetical protein
MSTELAIYTKKEIVALDRSNKKVDALLFNIEEAGGLKDSDLVKIKNPSGGALAWEVPTGVGDEVIYEKKLRGIIIGKFSRRTLWKDKSVGSGEVPVCSSNDMITGTVREDEEGGLDIPENISALGTPGGDCSACYFNQWGTATDGKGQQTRGKMCQESLTVYFLRTDKTDVLPVKLTIPGGSLSSFDAAVKKLPVRWTKAIIEFTLAKAKNAAGTDYAQYQAEAVGELDDETAAELQTYGKMIQKAIDAARASKPSRGKEREDEIPEHLKM